MKQGWFKAQVQHLRHRNVVATILDGFNTLMNYLRHTISCMSAEFDQAATCLHVRRKGNKAMRKVDAGSKGAGDDEQKEQIQCVNDFQPHIIDSRQQRGVQEATEEGTLRVQPSPTRNERDKTAKIQAITELHCRGTRHFQTDNENLLLCTVDELVLVRSREGLLHSFVLPQRFGMIEKLLHVASKQVKHIP